MSRSQNKLKSIYLITLLLTPQFISAQHSFQVHIQTPYVKVVGCILEDTKENYLIFGGEGDNPEGIIKNKIWKISPEGDTLTHRIDIGDFQSSFAYAECLTDSGFLIMIRAGETSDWRLYNELIILQTDTSFNTQWIKRYKFDDYLRIREIRVLKDGFGYYLAGEISKLFNPSLRYPFFIRTNQVGDTIRTRFYETYSGLNSVYDAIFNPDSTHIWWFSGTGPSPLGRNTRRTIDTLFNLATSDTLMYRVVGRINALLISDTSLILSCNYNQRNYNWQPQDEDIGIILYDTSLHMLGSNFFGAPDTVDYPANTQGLCFRHPDTVFFTGMKNVAFSFAPQVPSWIIVGQIDSNLQPRYMRFYGGDAYYVPVFIIATNDGGSLIHSLVYNPEFDHSDFFILKLNPDGLIASNKQIIAPLRHALIWPNPVNEALYIYNTLESGLLQLYDISGRKLLEQAVINGNNTVNLSELINGVYIYSIKYKDGLIEKGKIIKK